MIQSLMTSEATLGASHPVLRLVPLLGFVALGLIFVFGICLFVAVRRFRRKREGLLAGRTGSGESSHLDPWAEAARRVPLDPDGPVESTPEDDLPDFGGRS
ncbi:MAG: hypothetical protein CMJ33_01740 [Phycisphaerae bacterium]|nr:hypothetical protein [Phycisphaerae bacterium]